jgi:glycosidase
LHGAAVGKIANILRQDELYPHPDWLVPFFANHDVPRLASEKGSSPEKILCAFGLILTLRGIPELYYGDEIAMPGGADPDNRRDFPGGWPGDARNAFVEEGRSAEQQKIFSAVQKLLRLRQEHAALRTGKLFHMFSDEESYVFVRQTEEDCVLVIFNNSGKSQPLTIPQTNTPLANHSRVKNLYGDATVSSNGMELKVTVPAQSVSIFFVDVQASEN